MIKHKKFLDIEHINALNISNFKVGDNIVIQEKIDGANAAIRYDSETDSLVAQSRKNILNISNNLRGFFDYVCSLDKQAVKRALGDNLILFGEWLVPHSVPYPSDKYNHFYVYDVYDLSVNMYLLQKDVYEITKRLGLTYTPVFYEGTFESWDKCKEYLGQTRLGGEYGEGIVVKNQDVLNRILNKRLDTNGSELEISNYDYKSPFYLKIVCDQFRETKSVKKRKEKTAEEIELENNSLALAETIITRARVDKMINKFVDEGIIPEQWTSLDMKTIVQNLPKRIYEDCVKEENEMVNQIPMFSKLCNKISMAHAKEYLKERIGI